MNHWHLRGRKAQDRWQHGGEVLKQAQRALDHSERMERPSKDVLLRAAEDVSSVLDDTQRLYNSLHHAALEAQQRERS